MTIVLGYINFFNNCFEWVSLVWQRGLLISWAWHFFEHWYFTR